MAITTYGDISPRMASQGAGQLLERASSNSIAAKFGLGESYWDDNEDEEDGDLLYICGHECSGYKPTASDPLAQRHCAAKGVHCKGDMISNPGYPGCLNYDPQPLDSMVGEHYYQDRKRDLKFRKYFSGLQEQAEKEIDSHMYDSIRYGTSVFYANKNVSLTTKGAGS